MNMKICYSFSKVKVYIKIEKSIVVAVHMKAANRSIEIQYSTFYSVVIILNTSKDHNYHHFRSVNMFSC